MSDYDAIAQARADGIEDRNYADITNLPPGFLEGFNPNLDTDLHVTFTGGSTSVEGRQVTINESHQIVDDDFVGSRIGPWFYYVYLDSLGNYKVDRPTPVFSDRYLYYAHPLFNWRAIGKLWVDTDGSIKYVTPEITKGSSTFVTVAPYDADEVIEADYQCTGTNDHILVNAAIDFVNGAWGGGGVTLLRGNFYTNDGTAGTGLGTITMKDNVTLQGEGHGSIVNSQNTGGYTIRIAGVDNCVLANFKLVGDTSDTIARIRSDTASENLTIHNVWVHTTGASGISLNGNIDVTLSGIKCTSCVTAISVNTSTGEVNLSDIFIDGGSTGTNLNGISLFNSSSVRITNALIFDLTSSIAAQSPIGLSVANSDALSASNITVKDFSHSDGGSAVGILSNSNYGNYTDINIDNIDSSTVANGVGLRVAKDYNSYASCTVVNCSGTGLDIQATADNTVLTGFVTESNGTDVSDAGTGTVFVRNGGDSYFQGGNVGIGTSSPGGILDLTDGSGRIVFNDNRIERWDSDTDNPQLWLNYLGYNGGSTRFRDTVIGDGKTNDVVFVDGSSGSVGINTTSPDTRFQVVGVSRFGEDTTNYSEFESDGTLEFNGNATVWRDINLAGAIFQQPAADIPDIDEFVDENGSDTGVPTYAFAIGEKVAGSFEMQHDYKEGSDIVFHVHWQGIAAPSGTDYVKWQLSYTLAKDGETLDAMTTISGESAIDTQYEFHRTDLTTISDATIDIGDQFLFVLERVAAAGDAYAGDALTATIGIHYECDTHGSRQIGTK